MFEIALEENAILIFDSALQWKGQIGAGLLNPAAPKIHLQISYLLMAFY